MAGRRPNYRLVKIHRNYTVHEIAMLFGINRNTVREWIKKGLPVIDRKRPMLILGCDLATFLLARWLKDKRPCQAGEIYCVRCRAPKHPAADMAEYHPVTAKRAGTSRPPLRLPVRASAAHSAQEGPSERRQPSRVAALRRRGWRVPR